METNQTVEILDINRSIQLHIKPIRCLVFNGINRIEDKKICVV